jgi:hypothetical protein
MPSNMNEVKELKKYINARTWYQKYNGCGMHRPKQHTSK